MTPNRLLRASIRLGVRLDGRQRRQLKQQAMVTTQNASLSEQVTEENRIYSFST